MLELVVDALWLMLPAYVSNCSAVLFAGKTPVDFGKTFIDGKRIFGPGKTLRGLIGGTLIGIFVGVLLQLTEKSLHLGLPSFDPIYVIVTLSFGAMLGDLVESFFKRRIGLSRGRPLPLADQLDFVAGAWVLTYIFFPAWFIQNFTPAVILIVLVLSPLIHLAVNLVGYKLGKKQEPW